MPSAMKTDKFADPIMPLPEALRPSLAKNHSPCVSVLMAACNAELTIHEALTSVVAQTFTDFEIIVVDDASNDRTVEIVRSINDPRIHLIQQKRNQGVTRTRQCALLAARGEYVAVLDADDVARPKRLECQIEFLSRSPDIVVVGSAIDMIDARGVQINTIIPPCEPLSIKWALLFGNPVAHSSTMYRREPILKLGGYDANVYAGEDYDLWGRIVQSGGLIAQLPTPLVRLRQHTRSLSLTEPPSSRDYYIQTIQKHIRWLTGQNVTAEVARVLHSNPPQPLINEAAATEALHLIADCLDVMMRNMRLTRKHARQIVELAVNELLRVARRHPRLFPMALMTAFKSALHHHPSCLLKWSMLKLWLGTACPLAYRTWVKTK